MNHAHLMLRSGDDVMMLDEQRTNSRYVCYFVLNLSLQFSKLISYLLLELWTRKHQEEGLKR